MMHFVIVFLKNMNEWMNEWMAAKHIIEAKHSAICTDFK